MAMTATELELSKKLLNSQQKIVRLEARLDKVETVLEAMCIKRRYRLLGFLRGFTKI